MPGSAATKADLRAGAAKRAARPDVVALASTPLWRTAAPGPVEDPALKALITDSCNRSLRNGADCRRGCGAGSGRDSNGLVEVGDDVVDVLEADRDSDQIGRHAAGDLILSRELRVGGGCGVDDQALGLADIGQQAEELDRVDELAAGFDAALEPKGDHSAVPAR